MRVHSELGTGCQVVLGVAQQVGCGHHDSLELDLDLVVIGPTLQPGRVHLFENDEALFNLQYSHD